VILTYCDQHKREIESNDETVPLRYIAARFAIHAPLENHAQDQETQDNCLLEADSCGIDMESELNCGWFGIIAYGRQSTDELDDEGPAQRISTS
jgi:hypothetical protein